MMIRISNKALSVVTAVAVAAGLAGCTTTASGNGGGSGIVTPDGAIASTTNDGATAILRGPMSELLAEAYGTDLSPVERAIREEIQGRRWEELTAQCMREQGFEFPNLSYGEVNEPLDASLYQPENRDWVAQWGYGLFNQPTITRETPPDDFNPMRDFIYALSETERPEWMRAYSGTPWPELVEQGIATEGGIVLNQEAYEESLGCSPRASQQIDDETGLSVIRSEEFEPLFEAWNEFSYTPTGVTDEDIDWAACMADKGFAGFQKQGDALRSLVDQMDAVMGNFEFIPGSAITPELQPIADREIELALADVDCRNTTNFRARQQQRAFDAETQFVNDHHEAVTALRNALEQRG